MERRTNLEFQITYWDSTEVYDETDELVYQIRLFGRTRLDEDVCLRVENFTPFFYIKIPTHWKKLQISMFMEYITKMANYSAKKSKEGASIENSLLDYYITKKKEFFGFRGGKEFNYLCMTFKSHYAFKYFKYQFMRKINYKQLNLVDYEFDIYESGMIPYLRFMHQNNITAGGWVSIKQEKLKALDNYSYCDLEYSVDWNDVEPLFITKKINDKEEIVHCDDILPLKILSFDLECKSSDDQFPQAERDDDNIIQIGMTICRYGEQKCYKKILISLKNCDEIEDTKVYSCKTEKEVLLKFSELLRRNRPDFITGYNIFMFDFPYLHDRAVKLGIEKEFSLLGRIQHERCPYDKINLSSSALGDNELHMYTINGCVVFDTYKDIQRNYQLSEYKLDSVSATFIQDKIKGIFKIEKKEKYHIIDFEVEKHQGLQDDSFISIMIDDGLTTDKYGDGVKFKVISTSTIDDKKYIKVKIPNEIYDDLDQYLKDKHLKLLWAFAKDDIHHTEIFDCFKGDSKDRAKIGKYCIKDCELVNILVNKLDILTSNISMASICSVPISFLFLRGQSIKLYSLVGKYAKNKGYIIKDLPNSDKDDDDDEVGYEGAIVLKPIVGIYKIPIVTLDFNSLYPNSMREMGLSPEALVEDEEYKNLEEFNYIEIPIADKKTGKITTYTFAKNKNGEESIVPAILTYLLDARASTRAKMKFETDKFKLNILDKTQNNYKLTANSLYGQMGNSTSKIRCFPVAACTTATGRMRLLKAKKLVEEKFGARIVYGDTDSIFIDFHIDMKDGYEKALIEAIKKGKEASELINANVGKPQKIVYEKTFLPFILLNKKKYTGNLYEEDPKKFKQKNMGIVLKRRDNAPIVKIVVGGIVNCILNNPDPESPTKYTHECMEKLLNGYYNLNKFIISKSLRAKYKNPMSVAHKVLADRMRVRDPGTAPNVNDRVPYAFVSKIFDKKKKKKTKQGLLIEHPDYIKQHKLEIDHEHYITNQIMVPACEFLQLITKKPEKIFEKYIGIANNRKMNIVDYNDYITKNNNENYEIAGF